jgi:hypothetical protein
MEDLYNENDKTQKKEIGEELKELKTLKTSHVCLLAQLIL